MAGLFQTGGNNGPMFRLDSMRRYLSSTEPGGETVDIVEHAFIKFLEKPDNRVRNQRIYPRPATGFWSRAAFSVIRYYMILYRMHNNRTMACAEFAFQGCTARQVENPPATYIYHTAITLPLPSSAPCRTPLDSYKHKVPRISSWL